VAIALPAIMAIVVVINEIDESFIILTTFGDSGNFDLEFRDQLQMRPQ